MNGQAHNRSQSWEDILNILSTRPIIPEVNAALSRCWSCNAKVLQEQRENPLSMTIVPDMKSMFLSWRFLLHIVVFFFLFLFFFSISFEVAVIVMCIPPSLPSLKDVNDLLLSSYSFLPSFLLRSLWQGGEDPVKKAYIFTYLFFLFLGKIKVKWSLKETGWPLSLWELMARHTADSLQISKENICISLSPITLSFSLTLVLV